MWFIASEAVCLLADAAAVAVLRSRLWRSTWAVGGGKPPALFSPYAKSQRLLIIAVSCQSLLYIPVQKY